MKTLLARCRSMLFVPAHIEQFVYKAQTRGADLIILDLEDSVPSHLKATARIQVANAVQHLDSHGITVGIRINRDIRSTVQDLDASIMQGVHTVLVSKTMDAGHLRLLDELITELEVERGLPTGSIRMIALIETLAALSQVNDIAKACPRLSGLALGGEDLSADGNFEPTQELLFHPSQQIVFAAKAAGIQAFGFPGSITEYGDLNKFSTSVSLGRALGFDGALCIHPSQVDVLNEAFQPNHQEIANAKRVIEAYETAISEHRGAVVLDGKMIDLPVVTRARMLLSKC